MWLVNKINMIQFRGSLPPVCIQIYIASDLVEIKSPFLKHENVKHELETSIATYN